MKKFVFVEDDQVGIFYLYIFHPYFLVIDINFVFLMFQVKRRKGKNLASSRKEYQRCISNNVGKGAASRNIVVRPYWCCIEEN